MTDIPKIIHYCWFGNGVLPDLALRCIASWKKHFPDYEIKEWNESNFDISCCAYVQEAYAARKYAFVSDYARYWILEREGGIYFDVDVEVVKPFTDVLNRGAFMGCEFPHDTLFTLSVNPGLGMGIEAHHPFLQEILKTYGEMSFMLPDGELNLTTIVTITTNLLRKKGLQEKKEIQCVEGIWIYPEEFFCPINYYTGAKKITANTLTIHHYAASWLSPITKVKIQVQRILYKIPLVKALVTWVKRHSK